MSIEQILFCNLCQCVVTSTQKFLVQQYIQISKYQVNEERNSKQRQLFLTHPTTSNERLEFNIDLCRSLISAGIPLHKLNNEFFRKFLQKYTPYKFPDDSTVALSTYYETVQKINEIKDGSIWFSIYEIIDKECRLVDYVDWLVKWRIFKTNCTYSVMLKKSAITKLWLKCGDMTLFMIMYCTLLAMLSLTCSKLDKHLLFVLKWLILLAWCMHFILRQKWQGTITLK